MLNSKKLTKTWQTTQKKPSKTKPLNINNNSNNLLSLLKNEGVTLWLMMKRNIQSN